MVRAIGGTRPGGPDALGEFDLVAEPIGPGQVRVRVSGATVDPADTMIRSRPRRDEAGAVRVPGMEVAGLITEIGPAVDRPFAIGDAVMAIVVPSGAHGGYRADLVVPARSVTKIPAGLSDVQAATIPMNGLTARLALDTLALPADVDGLVDAAVLPCSNGAAFAGGSSCGSADRPSRGAAHDSESVVTTGEAATEP
ncbi:alcohol dehydrogenase catalytic domain-containing protein [Streptosporangium algeriense]|uniref:Alcohol dehydrogenase catalytic domain-containing protein n=1 Tax=Streptosporangium algeriense TaxID=1682748 RepID=A0ABW3E2S3_9ACTN